MERQAGLRQKSRIFQSRALNDMKREDCICRNGRDGGGLIRRLICNLGREQGVIQSWWRNPHLSDV